MRVARLFVLLLLLGTARGKDDVTPLDLALEAGEQALAAAKYDDAWLHITRALERDAQSLRAWDQRARWGEAKGDQDEFVYALHKLLALAIAQGEPKEKVDALRARLKKVDPIAADVLTLKARFLGKLAPLAQRYEKKRRPHSAIAVHQTMLALDPEREESRAAIQRISAAPDPSLADTAQKKDLFAGVSEAWIEKHDRKHGTWKKRAEHKSEHYTVQTDAGYRVLLLAGEAMDQMNAFYRTFFDYGTEDKPKSVPRIDVNIFKDRDEYLKFGIGPPREWTGGHFTGGAVETYIGSGGFDETTRTLFHEAAHQFVALATNATGWLNEGLASFFEGCRIQANGTVLMNMPADHRLFPLAERMEQGWMRSHIDGMDEADPSKSRPTKAPTFRIIIEDKYEWGPPWYAPTWGVVYFLYNYQDPVDGRFVYRKAFKTFIDKSGGRAGDAAVTNFEKVVLAKPAPPTPETESSVALPKTVAELDEVWRAWILALRDVQSGKRKKKRPYLEWARHAIKRKAFDDADEHFEKGLVATPNDVELLEEYADHLLAVHKNKDRAGRLLRQAIRALEAEDLPDRRKIEALDSKLAKMDRSHRTLKRIRAELAAAAHSIVKRYAEKKQDRMVMDLSVRYARELGVAGMLDRFEVAAKRSKKSLALWRLAYNERNLSGWAGARGIFIPEGPELRARFDQYRQGVFDYQALTLDEITSGDFSLEAEVFALRGQNAFCGLVFGAKSPTAYHALIFFPGVGMTAREGEGSPRGFLDLTSFYSPGVYKIWRHNPVDTSERGWHKLRLDVTGTEIDVWFDGELVVTHEFPHVDVVRGSFGLFTGRGEAKFRNVRYLARQPRDPSARIEREVRMAKFRVEGKAVGGSWLKQVPPWIKEEAWIQGKRESWAEKGPVPTLFVIWSIRQNDMMPIHAWLSYLQRQYADTGLQIVSIAGPDKPALVAQHLKTNPFPGAVAVDSIGHRGGYGNTLDLFEVGKRFNLPRVLLLDIDQRVVWEGGPGFPQGQSWRGGVKSYLDEPLKDLVERRKLRELYKWRQAWRPAADVDASVRMLVQSRDLPAKAVPAVAKARLTLHAVEGALHALEDTALALAKAKRDPALPVLMDWAEVAGITVPAKTKKAIKNYLKGKRVKNWLRILKLAKRAKDEESIRKLIGHIGTTQDAFPRALAEGLKEALDKGDVEAALKRIAEAPKTPGRWLVHEHFGFYR